MTHSEAERCGVISPSTIEYTEENLKVMTSYFVFQINRILSNSLP